MTLFTGIFGWSLNGTWNCLLGRGASEFTQEEWSYVLNPDLLIILIVSIRKVSLSGGVFVADGVPSTEYFLLSVVVEGSICSTHCLSGEALMLLRPCADGYKRP